MRIGYACQTIGVPETAFRSCTMKNASAETLTSVIEQNLTVLERIIDYNIANHISLFRITSDLIPFGSSPVNQLNWWELYHEKLSAIGRKASQGGIRLSMHPGQYTVLNSPDEEVAKRAVKDLEYHTRLLDSLASSQENKIILHIGGSYGNKKIAMERFTDRYHCLSDAVRRHLVIENDDKIYPIDELLELSERTGAPVVFDVLHHMLNPDTMNENIYDWIALSCKTWRLEDGNQKIHYSQQNRNRKPGSHSETISLDLFEDFLSGLGSQEPDIMLEVKDKNLSAMKCLNLINENCSIQSLELEWSRYKYLVLEKSHTDYMKIRQLLRDKSEYPLIEFYRLIDHAMSMEPSIGGVINAADHVWGYFKDMATPKEKSDYLALRNKAAAGSNTHKRFLWRMTVKYHEPYLLQSYYFKDVLK